MSEPPPGSGWWLGSDGQWHPPDPPPPQPTGPVNSMAIAALVLGILGVTCFPLFGSVAAVVCGHVARRQLRSDTRAERGDGLALAGLILGYIVIGFALVVVAGNIVLQFQ